MNIHEGKGLQGTQLKLKVNCYFASCMFLKETKSATMNIFQNFVFSF